MASQADNAGGRSGDPFPEMYQRISSLTNQCQYRAASRVTREMRRLAKSEQRIGPYLHANFYLMNDAQSLLEVESGIEVAIETIALLESEEQARKIQPNFPEEEYYGIVAWMTACAYDNLGKHMAEREGYNSDGVHDCINDGINICRKTGKLQCVTCFREYASDVFRAADDLPMALHHARYVASHVNPNSTNDRRWVGAKAVADLLLLSGDLEVAREAACEALALSQDHHNPLSARYETHVLLQTILHLQNRDEDLPELLTRANIDPDAERAAPAGEYPYQELRCALCDAVQSAIRNDFDTALRSLAYWDRWLTSQRALNTWFEVRLRLIATHLLAGRADRIDSLVRPLKEKATASRDWLTLRRLDALLERSFPVSPLALTEPLSSGPYARPSLTATDTIDQEGLSHSSLVPSAATASEAGDSLDPANEPDFASTLTDSSQSGEVAETSQSAEESQEELSPLRLRIEEFASRLREVSGEESEFLAIWESILQVEPADLVDPRDAAWLIHLAQLTAKICNRQMETWSWASAIAAPFHDDATVLSVLADLGQSLHELDRTAAEAIIPTEQLEAWFRTSLELDPNQPNNFSRAANYYQAIGRTSEAERCLARSFRLDRTNGQVAVRLSDLYSNSDRPRDALAALDLCIREGCLDAPVFWQAGLLALSIDEYDSGASYFARFEELEPDQPWTSYYRALCLLEANRPQQALPMIELEARRSPDYKLPQHLLRCWAASLQQQPDLCERELQAVLEIPLSTIDYLTEAGLARLFARLYRAASILPSDRPAWKSLIRVLLQSGLAPEELFQADRESREVEQELDFYICVVRQTLPDDWSSTPGCLSGQQNWKEYMAAWGVLAANEEQAQQTVQLWQSRCCRAPSRIVDLQHQGDGIEDRPGIVWQGIHQPVDNDSPGDGTDLADEDN